MCPKLKNVFGRRPADTTELGQKMEYLGLPTPWRRRRKKEKKKPNAGPKKMLKREMHICCEEKDESIYFYF